MEIMSGISAVANAYKIAKALRDLEKDFDAVTYKQQIIELMEGLNDARSALMDAHESNKNLEDDIQKLKAAFSKLDELETGDGGYLYQVNEEGDKQGFPVCPKCFETEKRQIHLVQNERYDSSKCPVCATEFKPVTCYLKDGETLKDQVIAERKRKSAEQSNLIRTAGRRNNWMAR